MDGTRMVGLRRERGWTQERLAEESGVTTRTVQRLEAGAEASPDTLSRVASALEVPVRELVGAEPAGGAGAGPAPLDDAALVEPGADPGPDRGPGSDPGRADRAAREQAEARERERQQRRRDGLTDGLHALYGGVGALVTVAVLVGVVSDLLPNLAIAIVPAYWIGGWALSAFLFLVVVSPRLDRRWPLSQDRDPVRD